MSEKKREYHGWVLVEHEPGYRDVVAVEWTDEQGNRRRYRDDSWRGESGCAMAIEWWERKLEKSILLQPTLRGCYRVYVEV